MAFKYIYNSLKPFISAYRPLINKRALICDHREIVYFGRICLFFEKMFVYFGYLFNFDRDRNLNLNLNLNFLKYFYSKGLKTLKPVCRPPVSLIDKQRLICDHIKNICQSQCKVMIDSIKMSDNIISFFRSHCQTLGGSVRGRILQHLLQPDQPGSVGRC